MNALKASSWAEQQFQQLGYRLLGEPKIVRDRPWSIVSEFTTSAGRFYLKQMAGPFVHEPIVLKFISDHAGPRVSQVVASNSELQCFLMSDAGDPMRTALFAYYDVSLVCDVLQVFASIQIQCAPYAEALIALGINDWRLKHLPQLYQDFIAREDFLKSDGMKSFEIDALVALSEKIERVSKTLTSYGIPETIEHGDFHDNNVLLKDGVVTINDWGDTIVTHPFFSCVSFLESARREHGLLESYQKHQQLKLAYLNQWSAYGSQTELVEAFSLATWLMNFVFAMSFSRIRSCSGIEKLTQYDGYIANSLRKLIG